jgi:uncharacterized protein (TIGR03000 family)
MMHRLRHFVLLGFILVAVRMPTPARAQDAPPVVRDERAGWANPAPASPREHGLLHRGRRGAGVHGDGYWHSGYPYGPRVAPSWSYYGLGGGPYIGYPWGWYGYPSAAFDSWTNGLSLYGPPVPVYGPIPGVFGNNDLVRRWQGWPSIGFPFGWFGMYSAWPRPRPLTVTVHPSAESVPIAPNVAPAPPAADPTAPAAGALVLSVKVPQPAAEVFVDGVKTAQTGTERVFESPPLEAGKRYKYEVTAKWIEGGATREAKRAVVGTPGEVVRVDFTSGN